MSPPCRHMIQIYHGAIWFCVHTEPSKDRVKPRLGQGLLGSESMGDFFGRSQWAEFHSRGSARTSTTT